MIIARAPVRISFGGGGTDLAAYYERFGGLVLSTAITRYCYVFISKRSRAGIGINSASTQEWTTCQSGRIPLIARPLALPRAALAWFMEQGWLHDDIDLFLTSEVPSGSGLGSSSALAVALIAALGTYCGRTLRPAEIAELACQLEIERLQMPIGKQDQYASAYGGLNTLEFSAQGVQARPLALPADILQSLNAHLLLFATGLTHNSSTILGAQQKSTREEAKTQDTLHAMKQLAAQMREALLAGQLDHFGHLLDQGWQAKRSLSGAVTTSDIDHWYALARQSGAIGGKITGAGGGGFLLLYCPLPQQQAVRKNLTQQGLQELEFEFATFGPQVSEHAW
ncbi:GHMP family kinase ATP-binding protein [Dictyobacter arantiisoli]|uniref:GHMP kinase n=1 Tax=Dictyobacter arantiisoli TaxID=2014874 RepID=A0A5A5T8C1_9CHLR|nr:GHMP kinase [Dictyobacter arantiisoli]GCF07515.1 GHMP kinase [Dictyobacter arantiisoli]